jgi:hypothetical protein
LLAQAEHILNRLTGVKDLGGGKFGGKSFENGFLREYHGFRSRQKRDFKVCGP